MLTFEQSLMPRLYRIRQTQEIPFLKDPEPAIEAGMAPYLDRIKPGMRVAVAAGSRGIYHYARMIKCVVDVIKKAGASPFIIPAMGSHGGATAEGQLAVLASYGITEESMGAPILSSMETVVIGHTEDGAPVNFDKNAYGMDGIIMCNRVKPHTAFHGPVESGITKMGVIGGGKQKGQAQFPFHMSLLGAGFTVQSGVHPGQNGCFVQLGVLLRQVQLLPQLMDVAWHRLRLLPWSAVL